MQPEGCPGLLEKSRVLILSEVCERQSTVLAYNAIPSLFLGKAEGVKVVVLLL